jgi:hypothetical protein
MCALAFFLQIFIYRACGTNEIKSATQSDENLLKWLKNGQIG